MKVALCSAVWQRQSLSVAWWKAVKRLRLLLQLHGLEADLVVGGSEPFHHAGCDWAGGTWVKADNAPLGNKWNRIAVRALDAGSNYLFLMGMDDFFTDEALLQYVLQTDCRTPFTALQGFYAYDTLTQRALKFLPDRNGNMPPPPGGPILKRKKPKSTFGAGWLLHRSLFEGHEFFWEPDKERGLDASLHRTLKLPVPHMIKPTSTAFMLDVKTADNIWSFETLAKLYPSCLMSDTSVLSALPEWPEIQAL